MKVKKNCNFCGNNFEGPPQQLYCKPICYYRASNLRRLQRKKEIIALQNKNNKDTERWGAMMLNSGLNALRELAGLPARESAG